MSADGLKPHAGNSRDRAYPLPFVSGENWSSPGLVDTYRLWYFGGRDVNNEDTVPGGISGTHHCSASRGREVKDLAQGFEPGADTIRRWIKQVERDAGQRTDIPIHRRVYNTQRRYSALGYLSPIHYEKEALQLTQQMNAKLST